MTRAPSIHDRVPIPEGARLVDDPDELAAFFATDPAAHVYSLVDLEEPYWSASRWFRRGDAVVGVVANPADGLVTATGVSTLDPGGSLALLAEVAVSLPAGLVLTGPVGLGDALARHRPVRWCEPHVKYALTDRTAVPTPPSDVVPLGVGDLGRLQALHATEPGAAFFLPSMVESDSFVGIAEGTEVHDAAEGTEVRGAVEGTEGHGVSDDIVAAEAIEASDASGSLVAAAGTHLVSDRRRLAAIGSVFVRADHRGRGLGRAVTAGVVHRLADRCDVIGLNVAAVNAPARAIYESIGFTRVLDYDEAELG